MATDSDREETIRRQMLDNFTPVEPADAGSLSNELMEQVIISNSSAEGFGHIVLKQWRSDSRAEPPREVWAVLGSEVETHLFAKDLADGRVSDSVTEPIPPETVVGKDQYGIGLGKILVITFKQLVDFLGGTPRRVSQYRPAAHLTVMMNFGHGRVTFDMALSSTMLMRTIKHGIKENLCRIAACTVANVQAPFFGYNWPPRRIQELDMCQDKDGRQVLEPVTTDYVWHDAVDKDDALLKLLDIETRLVDPQGKKRAAIVIYNSAELPPQLPPGEAVEFSTEYDQNALDRIRNGPSDRVKRLIITRGVSYCGPIQEMSHIIVYPFAPGWVFDNKTSHVVTSNDTICKAEVHHAARLRDKAGAAVAVHCLMSRRDYEKLPLLPQNSAAHSLDLPRLLLACICIWDQDELPFHEIPVSMPSDEYVVEEQLRRLWLKGLIDCRSGPARPHGAVGRRLLHSALETTALGLETSILVMCGAIESFHVACLAGQLLCGLVRTDNAPGMIANLAAILETKEGATSIQPVLRTQQGWEGHLLQLKGWWVGPAAEQVGRGPIWAASALWHKLRASYDLRLPKKMYHLQGEEHYTRKDLIEPPGAIRVDVYESYEWDDALSAIEEQCGGETPSFGDDVRLTREELVEIDKALVLAFLDKLAFVPGTDSGAGPFAYDLVSHRELQAPPSVQSWQLNLDVCHQLEAQGRGQRATGIFCIYTMLSCGVDAAGNQTWTPWDLTHVLSEAVYKVLEEVREDEPVENLLRKIRTDPPPEL